MQMGRVEGCGERTWNVTEVSRAGMEHGGSGMVSWLSAPVASRFALAEAQFALASLK